MKQSLTTNLMSNNPLIIFGGTFDPIHYGHLRLAENLHNLLPDAEIRILPSAQPPLRDTPQSSAADRLAMVKLAVEDTEHLVVDDRELGRSGMSYTFISALELAEEFPERRLLLLLGSDAYLRLNEWHNWRELTQLLNIIVVARPTEDLASNAIMEGFHHQLQLMRCDSINELLSVKSQAVYHYPAPMLDISATQIRQLIAKQLSPRFLLPRSVINYIQHHQLYEH